MYFIQEMPLGMVVLATEKTPSHQDQSTPRTTLALSLKVTLKSCDMYKIHKIPFLLLQEPNTEFEHQNYRKSEV